jgi:hypothetical protein
MGSPLGDTTPLERSLYINMRRPTHIVTKDQKKYIVTGDSGGPLAKPLIDGSYKVLGLTTGGGELGVSTFLKFSSQRVWICNNFIKRLSINK